MRTANDKKMGMWNHEYRRGSKRVHAYQTWRVDSEGGEYDFRGSDVPCNCSPSQPQAAMKDKGEQDEH